MENDQIYGTDKHHQSGLSKDQAVESYFFGDEQIWLELLDTLEADSINENLKEIHKQILAKNHHELRSALHKMKSPVA
jgi:hypothetical protein